MSISSVVSCSLTLNKTFTRFSENGRPFTTASCARRTLAAATSFIASVIFCVFFTVAIRSRKSFNPAVTMELPLPSRLPTLSQVNTSTDPAGSTPRRPRDFADNPSKVAILSAEPQAMEDAIAHAAKCTNHWQQKDTVFKKEWRYNETKRDSKEELNHSKIKERERARGRWLWRFVPYPAAPSTGQPRRQRIVSNASTGSRCG